MLSIEQQIYQNAQTMPNYTAVVSMSAEITYYDLWANIARVAVYLKETYHLNVGDRLILSASGDLGFVYTYFALHVIGCVAVPIDPDVVEARFNYINAEIEPQLIIGTLRRLNKKTLSFDALIDDAYRHISLGYKPSSKLRSMDEPADILFTTGTTGAPKGVVLTHTNLAAAARNINEYIGNDDTDVELLALPVSHSFGLGRLRCVLSRGGQIILLGTFARMKTFFKLIKTHHVTGFGMVPASWLYIKEMSGDMIKEFADQLNYIEIGSSFMPIEEKELLMEWLPKTRICMHYGLTEASRSAFMEFHEYANNLNSIGKPAPNVDVRIIDEEICVKGEHVTNRYWNESPERIAQDFHGDYYLTGDSGWMDEEGNIYIKGRIKEMINVGGEKVSPMEVEDVLNAIPQIKESACCAMPDKVMGEVVETFIVEKEPITDADIMEIIKPQLENYKWPKKIVRITEIPKTSSGKIQRLQLKEC